MWSFFKKQVEKKRIREAFGEFMSEQALQEIEKSIDNPARELPFPSLQKETIGYVILQVRGDTSEQLQHQLAQTLDIILANEGIVEEIISSIFVAVFRNTPDSHRRLIATLRDKIGSDVRAAYGHGEHDRGGYGSRRRFTYGTIFPDISTKLETLLSLEFGTWKEA